MKKKIITILSLILCFVCCLSFAACEKKNDKHTAKSEWSNDTENHWHECVEQGHDDKMNFGAHEFGDIITVQTGDDAKPAKQVKACYICGYEVFSSLKMKDTVGLTPAVAVGDETSVKNSLSELLTKIEAQLGVPMFDYDEFVPDAGGYFFLTDEDIAVNAVLYDFSDVDLSAPGYKTIIVSYNGTKCYFEILLTPDLSSVAKTEYKSEDWGNSTADLYANGYLALNYDTGLSHVLKCDMLDEVNGIMTLYLTENTKQLIILDDENKTLKLFDAYMLGGEPAVYSMDDRGYVLNVYTKNGKSYANIYSDGGETFEYVDTVSVSYPTENSIFIPDMGVFVIDEDDNLTAAKESYTGEFVKDGKTYKIVLDEENKRYDVYFVTLDDDGNRTESLVAAILYVSEKNEMAIYVISFENKTVNRYTIG